MVALTEAGLEVRADLLNFRSFMIVISSMPHLETLRLALSELGLGDVDLPTGSPPLTLPVAIPDLQARLVAAALRARGIDAAIADIEGMDP